MFSIPIYPTDPIERVEWYLKYQQNIMHYIQQIYFEDMFYKHYPQSFVLHMTFRTIYQILKEMRVYITSVNNYIEHDKYLYCLASADQQTDAIRLIIKHVKIHEKNVTSLYEKYWKLYQEDPPFPLPTYPPFVPEEGQEHFQIL
jgi:hypothetical protein